MRKSGNGDKPLRGVPRQPRSDPGQRDQEEAILPGVSPDELNHYIRTVIVAPMTTKGKPYPCRFKGKKGQVVLDQIRTVDREPHSPECGDPAFCERGYPSFATLLSVAHQE
jgi:hypothetical protein